MMNHSNFGDVGEFHDKFGLPNSFHPWEPRPAGSHDEEMLNFRLAFMQEELDEFELGAFHGSDAEMADALIDLVYVAMGTAHMLGYPWQPLWDDVQRANMTKERAKPDGSNSKRGSGLDVVKPEGWVGPKTQDILAQYGFGDVE